MVTFRRKSLGPDLTLKQMLLGVRVRTHRSPPSASVRAEHLDPMKGGLVGHPWTWYTLAMMVGVYRMTRAGLDAVVRRVVRIASQASAELGSDRRFAAASDTSTTPTRQGHADAVVSVVVTCGHHETCRRAVLVHTVADRVGRLNVEALCLSRR
jgi:hypothetical protein